jgi:hypothetical protein
VSLTLPARPGKAPRTFVVQIVPGPMTVGRPCWENPRPHVPPNGRSGRTRDCRSESVTEKWSSTTTHAPATIPSLIAPGCRGTASLARRNDRLVSYARRAAGLYPSLLPLNPTVLPITLSNVVAVGRHANGNAPRHGQRLPVGEQGDVLELAEADARGGLEVNDLPDIGCTRIDTTATQGMSLFRLAQGDISPESEAGIERTPGVPPGLYGAGLGHVRGRGSLAKLRPAATSPCARVLR